jgi:hypothetical protein
MLVVGQEVAVLVLTTQLVGLVVVGQVEIETLVLLVALLPLTLEAEAAQEMIHRAVMALQVL